MLDRKNIDQAPETYLNGIGQVFARFDEHTQDSGNISYGVRIGQGRFFVKTAGHPEGPQTFLPYGQRVALLRTAVRLRCSLKFASSTDLAMKQTGANFKAVHRTLPQLHNVIESPAGPLLVYAWTEGTLLHADSATRNEPQSALQRFRRLPAAEILQVLDLIFELHFVLAQLGWIAVDFYDGCLLYDFTRRDIHVIDLDMYREGPFTNEMGRMFGSSRFMAPEEFERGALIDERTNVFTMGRTAAVLLADGTLARSSFRGSDAHYAVICRACRRGRSERFASIAALYTAWRAARAVSW